MKQSILKKVKSSVGNWIFLLALLSSFAAQSLTAGPEANTNRSAKKSWTLIAFALMEYEAVVVKNNSAFYYNQPNYLGLVKSSLSNIQIIEANFAEKFPGTGADVAVRKYLENTESQFGHVVDAIFRIQNRDRIDIEIRKLKEIKDTFSASLDSFITDPVQKAKIRENLKKYTAALINTPELFFTAMQTNLKADFVTAFDNSAVVIKKGQRFGRLFNGS